ncbi:MAG: restriction endonuclease subunit S [Chloroflexi bacterium]|nr:restriction endonuclease subunit S [Chloroflexota bacterium]
MSNTLTPTQPDLASNWKPYPSYKESHVYWLGCIPVHWEVKRLRFACRVNPPKSELAHLHKDTRVSFLPMERIGEDGSLTFGEERAIEDVWQGFTYFRDGDIIVAKITPCFENGKSAHCLGLANGVGFGTTELHVLRPDEGVHSQFVLYLIRSHVFRSSGTASMYGSAGQQRLPDHFVRNFAMALPPLPEQRAIAAFLDRETAKLDALIAKKERLIELLQEERSALISRAVTKGLDQTVPMKDSGVEWLGVLPVHWEICRVKFLATQVTSGSRGWAQHYSDEGPMFLRIGNLTRTSINLDLSEVQHVYPPEGAEGWRTRVSENDVLISITAYVGSVGVVGDDIGEAYVNQHIALARPHQSKVEPRWLGYCLLSQVGQDQFRMLLYGGTKDGLGLEDVRNLMVLVPPKQERCSIAAFLDHETARIDALITKVREGVDRLKEYRTALISAAVTGKIDVRGEVEV